MSNQDEESKESKDAILPSYQFFSPDLNYNYFTDSSSGADAPSAVTASGLPSTATSKTVTPASVTPNPMTYTPSSTNFIANLAAPTPAAVVQVEPEKVPYSLVDDGPEPTFEERVAAMEREIAAADAASSAARVAEQAAAARAAAVQATPEAPSSISYPSAIGPIPAQYSTALADATQSGEWNAFEQTRVPEVFSPDFNFNRSLLKIFWRIDIDHNNRISKNELAIALQESWFQGDEKVLARLLFDMYEDISPEAIFCDAGLSVNNILSFGPFGDMVAEQVETEMPQSTRQPERNNAPKKKTTNKSSQSLRSMFKR